MKMDTKERQRFRNTKQWKEFRRKLIEKQKKDAITGNPLTITANCHHCLLDYERYTELNDENFVMLNKESHDVTHFFFLKSKPREWRKRVLNLIKILKKMEKLNSKQK